MTNTAESKVFLPRTLQVTSQFIQGVLNAFHLSRNELDARMGYSKHAHYTNHILSEGNTSRFLNQRYVARFWQAYAELLKDKGFYHIVTNTTDEPLPKQFRIATLPRLCKGHQELTFFGNKQDKFCDAECKQLFLARERERKAKAKLKLKGRKK